MGRKIMRERRKKASLAAAAATAALAASGAYADPNTTVDYTIGTAQNTNWSLSTDWSPNSSVGGPDGAGLYVKVSLSISNVRTVTVWNGDFGDSTKTIGRLDIGDTSGYGASDRFQINAGTGSGVLDFDGNGGVAQINTTAFTSGDQINAAISLSTDLDVTNNATNSSSTLQFSNISASSARTLTLKKGLVRFNGTVNSNVTLRLGDASGSNSAGMTFIGNTYNSNIVARSGSTNNTLTVGNSGNTAPILAGLVTVDHDLTVRASGTGSVTLSGTVSGAALTGSSNVLISGAATSNVVTLGGNNSGFSGAVSIQSGTFRVSTATALSSANTVYVAGGTLGGTGTVAASVNVASGGILAAANTTVAAVGTLSTGNLALAGKLSVDVNTTTNVADKVAVNGTVDVTGGTLDVALAGTASGAYGQLFVLINNDGDLVSNGADAIVGSFAGLTRGGPDDSATLSNGSILATLYYSYDAASSSLTGGNDLAIQVTSVPEPGVLSVLSIAPAALLTRRRQRRKA